MKPFLLFFIVVSVIFVDISNQTEPPKNDAEVQSKVANLIRRILSSKILNSENRDSFLFQNPMRQAKVEEPEKNNRKVISPLNIEELLIKGNHSLQ